VQLRVADDGCGFDPDQRRGDDCQRWGLVGMQERARRIGGDLSITSSPGKGTEIAARVPGPSAVWN
jgi:signal transduction histidine kinase